MIDVDQVKMFNTIIGRVFAELRDDVLPVVLSRAGIGRDTMAELEIAIDEHIATNYPLFKREEETDG